MERLFFGNLVFMTEIFQNIRKDYIFREPGEALLPFVEFFSISHQNSKMTSSETAYSTVKMFPSWTPTFYINLGPAYYIDLNNTRYLIRASEDILVLRNENVTRYISSSDQIFTVKFYPGGLEAVLGVNQVPYIDRVTDLRHILPVTLLAAMKKPISFEERVDLMQRFFLDALTERAADRYLCVVSSAIADYQAGMRACAADVAERLFITSKTMNRYFYRVVGVAPKSYFTVLRARAALTAYVKDSGNFAFWDYGYYDQSHFRKEILKFTGRKLSDAK